MKYEWNEEDADPGRIVHKLSPNANPHSSEAGRLSDLLYIISYGYLENEQVYYLTSFADGMQVSRCKTREELAKSLTTGNYQPTSGADKDQIIKAAAKVALRTR